MKRISLAVLVLGLLGLAMGVVAPSLVHGQAEVSNQELVGALRILNTEEYSYHDGTGRFASRNEIIDYLRKKGDLSRSPIALENPSPYELAVTTSPDGAHYQISIQRPSVMNDKSTWCKTAAFTDDRGVIFLGMAIGCQSAAP